jgi:hypothetical protein
MVKGVRRVTLKDLFDEMDLYGFEDFEDSQKLRLLNEAYFDIVTREPWPFLEQVVEFKASNGTNRFTVDSLFKVRIDNNTLDNSLTNPVLIPYSEYTMNSVLSFIDVTNDIVMTPERGDVIEKNYRITNDTSTPSRYYFVGDDLFVYPSVSGNPTYRLYFLRLPVEATNSTDTKAWFIPPRHHSVVLYGALVKAFLVNDDPQSAVFQNLFESRYQQMRNDVWMNNYDRPDRIHVLSDSYDWSY